eukprot:TRINITY_DN8540_c0_g1_i1.p1 TRINITY_DN8540_c0_g1~~TRINITY_DN8540_c0_g1_i1.p1  ORF type:complete len:149 (-),score=32.79 TRINITY_DN8540_c0_g1_i1:282-686(-)
MTSSPKYYGMSCFKVPRIKNRSISTNRDDKTKKVTPPAPFVTNHFKCRPQKRTSLSAVRTPSTFGKSLGLPFMPFTSLEKKRDQNKKKIQKNFRKKFPLRPIIEEVDGNPPAREILPQPNGSVNRLTREIFMLD